jgi:hypothetical protein
MNCREPLRGWWNWDYDGSEPSPRLFTAFLIVLCGCATILLIGLLLVAVVFGAP